MGDNPDHSGDSEFDWVNAWFVQNRLDTASAAEPAALAAAPLKATEVVTPIRFTVRAPLNGQLMRDIAEIERVRDALLAIPVAMSMRQLRTLTLASSRTTDAVPVMVGGVFALVMLTVFGAAAAMSKLSR